MSDAIMWASVYLFGAVMIMVVGLAIDNRDPSAFPVIFFVSLLWPAMLVVVPLVIVVIALAALLRSALTGFKQTPIEAFWEILE